MCICSRTQCLITTRRSRLCHGCAYDATLVRCWSLLCVGFALDDPSRRPGTEFSPLTSLRITAAAGQSFIGGGESMVAGGGQRASAKMATMDPLQLKFIAFAVFGKGQAVADQAAAKPKQVRPPSSCAICVLDVSVLRC